MTGSAPGDGPWRVSVRVEIRVTGAAGPDEAACSDLTDGLRAAGLAVGDAGPDADLLIVDGATRVAPDAVLELRRIVGLDPMIVAAMPRIILPDGPDVPEGAWPPEIGYAVLPDLRCLYVKRSVAAALGEPLASGAIGDHLLALNRFGFRVATAGRAVAHHPEGAARVGLEDAPSEGRAVLARHLASAPAAADRLIGGLAPGTDGRRAIAFELSALTAAHSGTTRLATALVRRAAQSWPDLAVHVVATEAAFAAHLGPLGAAIMRVDPSDPRVFAAAIRIGQPFLWGELDTFAARAPVLVVFLLDTIGLDCLAHAPDELDALWRFVCAEGDGLLFNSAFTERQFERRFAIRTDLPRRASLHSLDLADYRLGATGGDREGDGVLVVGNAFSHKRLRETAEVLAHARLGMGVTALGLGDGVVDGVAGVPSGELSPERLDALYAAARIVVYPSVYEGFGFPILEALAHRRPILVRDLPPYREIAARLPEAANIHTYADDRDLVTRLGDPPAWRETQAEGSVRTWDDAAEDLRAVLDAALAGIDRARVVRRIDLLRGRMSYMRSLAFGGSGGGETLDRLAGAAGRMAQGAVATFGRRLPSPVLSLAARVFRGR